MSGEDSEKALSRKRNMDYSECKVARSLRSSIFQLSNLDFYVINFWSWIPCGPGAYMHYTWIQWKYSGSTSINMWIYLQTVFWTRIQGVFK